MEVRSQSRSGLADGPANAVLVELVRPGRSFTALSHLEGQLRVNSGPLALRPVLSGGLDTKNIKRTIQHGQPGLPVLRRQDRLPRLRAARILSPRAARGEVRAGNQPSRPHGPLFL